MEAKILATYIKENFAGKKTCLVSQNDDFGADAGAGFAAAGLNFDETVKYISGQQADRTLVAGWITKLATAKCEVVVLFSVSSATAAILGGSAAAAFRPQWILGSVGADATTIRIAANNPQASALMNGAIGASWLPDSADTTDEYIKLFREVNTKYNPGVDFDNNVLVGMNAALLTVQALRAAGSNPTRRSLILALETKGASFASASYSASAVSRTSHAGHTGFWFGKFNLAGSLIPVDTARTIYTTDSGSGPVTKAASKRATLPAKGIPTNS